MSLQAALAHFDAHRDGYVQDMFTLLRFQTISAQPEHARDLRDCAEWIRAQLEQAGLQAEVAATAGHPVVLADSGPVSGPGPTLLFYGHYDVQPIGDPGLWQSPAFDPQVRDGAVFARGSADDKGQVMTHLAAMRSWRAAGGEWPVRVRFIIEGEEEIGSPSLGEFVQRHPDRLACDYVVLSDTSKLDANTPALACSTRGLVYKELTVRGPAKDLHSGGYGGTVANPANVLAAIIASLHDAHHRVTIPGFYDDVQPLSPDERRELLKHAPPDEQWLRSTGSPALAGEEGFSTVERYGTRPTLDVNGLFAGYTGQGAATIIPAYASAKISMRLVANQNPERISKAFDEAVRRACPPTVRLEIATSSTRPPYITPSDSPGMRAAAAALTAAYGVQPVLLREGGTLPILPMFKEVLGADSLMIGFADPDCNLHSPNEFFHLRDFDLGTRCILQLLETMCRHPA